ncbi:uncharacterized protein LOC144641517 [Oculina patagonica]
MEDKTTEEKSLHPNTVKTVVCFFIFGLLSMITTEMIHTATQDILSGSHIASSYVILAAALPEILVKVACPWFVQNCSYLIRTVTVALLSIGGLVIIIIASDVHWRLVGVGVACCAGALGEITFLAFTSFYDDIAASAVAAGIGMSSLLGSYLYTAMTTWACVASRTVFGIIAPFVLLLFVAFYSLPKDHLPERQNSDISHQRIKYVPLESNTDSKSQMNIFPELSWKEMFSVASKIYPFITYMFLAYYAEYLANSAVITTLAFSGVPFSPRDHYLYYMLMYHLGKFLGRSHILIASCACPKMVPCIRVQKTWNLTLIECCHLLFFLMASWFRFFSSVWIVLILCFTEGFTAGSIYVNSVHAVSEQLPDLRRSEFALSLLMVGNDVGVLSAGLMGLHVEPKLKLHCFSKLENEIYCLTRHTGTGGWYSCTSEM